MKNEKRENTQRFDFPELYFTYTRYCLVDNERCLRIYSKTAIESAFMV